MAATTAAGHGQTRTQTRTQAQARTETQAQEQTQEQARGQAQGRPRARRLRSGTVVLGGVGLLATALTACGSDVDKRCVDRNSYDVDRGYKVLPSKDCEPSAKKKKRRSGSGFGSDDSQWYYGGEESGGWVEDGSFDKDAVDRGGFGSGSGSSGG